MARRKFLRYTRAEHLAEQILQRYIRRFPPAELYQHVERFPPLDSQHLFVNQQALDLEIGCGSAEPLCALAKAQPWTNYVGIDISGPSIEKAAENAATQGLENILFLHADFHLLAPLLVPRAIQSIYLHFPDPHTRPGYTKRRIFGAAFLDQVAYTLQPDGLLSVMTDHRGLFFSMLEQIEADSRFHKQHAKRYLIGFEAEVKSHFQRTWEHHGETVFRCLVRHIAEKQT